jgi:hypothetical protein
MDSWGVDVVHVRLLANSTETRLIEAGIYGDDG